MLLLSAHKTHNGTANGVVYRFCTPEKGLRANEERKRAARMLQELSAKALPIDAATFDAMNLRLSGWDGNKDVHGNRITLIEKPTSVKQVRINRQMNPPLVYENVILVFPKGFIYARGYSQDYTQLNFEVGTWKDELPNKILDLLCQREADLQNIEGTTVGSSGRSTVDKGLEEVIKFLSK